MFFRTNYGPAAIDILLDQVQQARAISSAQRADASAERTKDCEAPGDEALVVAPTLEQFLDDEDLLPECRSDNGRLIDYLTQDHILRALICLCTRRPGSNITTSNVEEQVKKGEAGGEDEAKRQFKWPYMASEVLAAEVERISDAVLRSNEHVDLLFDFLDAAPGSLDLFLCMHFGKVFNALLRTQHLRLLEEICKRKPVVLKLVKHVSCAPVSEILVRLLDGPESEDYNPSGNPPAHAAVALLTECNVVEELSNLFYLAASGELELERLGHEELPEVEKASQLERFLEETMESVTNTVLGITMKVLGMPVMKLEVPRQLNAYGNPEVVGKMLDGGILSARRKMPSAALGYALKLATELMTTDSNLAAEEPDEQEVTMFQMMSYMSPPGRRNFLSGTLTPQRGTRTRAGPLGGRVQLERDEEKNNAPRVQIMNTRLLEEACAARFEPLLGLMVQSNVGNEVINTSGRVQLLGSTRLRLVEFFVAFLKRGNDSTLGKLVELKVPAELLQLCLLHSWNSMVHGVVASSISGALKFGTPETINMTWLSANLVSWVVRAWRKNTELEARDEYHFRAGYMGSLISIAKDLDQYLEKMDPSDREAYVPDEVYDAFRTLVNGELKEMMEREARVLGGQRPNTAKAISDDDEEMYEEATEVLDMEEVIGGLTSGNNDAINLFANYLFQRDEHENELDEEEEEEDGVETIDVSEFENSSDSFDFQNSLGAAVPGANDSQEPKSLGHEKESEGGHGENDGEEVKPMNNNVDSEDGDSDDDDHDDDDDDDDDDDSSSGYERFVASPQVPELPISREGSAPLLPNSSSSGGLGATPFPHDVNSSKNTGSVEEKGLTLESSRAEAGVGGDGQGDGPADGSGDVHSCSENEDDADDSSEWVAFETKEDVSATAT